MNILLPFLHHRVIINPNDSVDPVYINDSFVNE